MREIEYGVVSLPECLRKISDRAKSCPHCGLPAKYFVVSETSETEITKDAAVPDLTVLRNALIAFDHSYQTLFAANYYITARELSRLINSFEIWSEQLADKSNYDYCKNNAHSFAIDIETANNCLRRFETLSQDAENHNAQYIDRILEQNKDYFDNLLKDIDPDIKIDEEQRRAVVTDDDYCLLVAGAGAGKTTTMAAKVKYLTEKKYIPPEDIIVISYTRKAAMPPNASAPVTFFPASSE